MKQKRLLELDSLRGIAAIAVVLYHYFYRFNEIYGHEGVAVGWSYFGQFGVELFFIISGFVIYWTLNRIKQPSDFLWSRFSRLYPVYWISLLLSFVVVWLYGLPSREISFFEMLANGFMFHEYFTIPHVDGVYWALTVELTFYFWVFIFFVCGQLKRIELLLSLFLIISFLDKFGVVDTPLLLKKLFILNHIGFFIAGICFYKIKEKSQNYLTYILLLGTFIFSAIHYSLKLSIVYFCFYVAFYLAVCGYLPVLRFRFFVFLGSISYPLYLVHQNIGFVVIREFYSLGSNPVLAIITASFLSLLLAYLLNKYIELPALKYIRRSRSKAAAARYA